MGCQRQVMWFGVYSRTGRLLKRFASYREALEAMWYWPQAEQIVDSEGRLRLRVRRSGSKQKGSKQSDN